MPPTHTQKRNKTPCECVESKVDVWLNVLSCGYFQVRKSLLQRADAWKDERPDILVPWQGLEEEAVSLRTVVRILRIFENFEDSREKGLTLVQLFGAGWVQKDVGGIF